MTSESKQPMPTQELLDEFSNSKAQRSSCIVTSQHLEQLALAAHARADTWNDFHGRYGADIVRAEPWDADARRKLMTRLSLLVTAGDLDGHRPPSDPEPWLKDDVPAEPNKPHDTRTAARLLWQPGEA
jgi:hypothetical protein